MSSTPWYELGPPLWPDGTVRLPDAIESWLDGHFAGEKGDDAPALDAARSFTAAALWSLIYRQGDEGTDQAAIEALIAETERAGRSRSEAHERTVIEEGGGRFTVICSCGWSDGRRFESEYSAGMAWAMDHMKSPNG